MLTVQSRNSSSGSKKGADGSYDAGMGKDVSRLQAKQVIAELRASADRLVMRSRQLADEALRMKERADDLEQLVKQHDIRKN
jgi:RNA-splicing ligase RtcB